MREIKWGIIGTGSIASKFARALNSMKDTKLVGVASRNINKAKEFSEKFQVEKAYGSYEDLVKDEEIDVIYIGTPHTEHKANAELCIKNGKAVLCEKPFTVNVADSEYLISLAKDHKVFIMEAMWTKFLPVTIKVKQWIKDGRIGKVRHFRISFGYSSPFDPNNRLYNPDLAGGALLDVGVYPITYVVHMMDCLPDKIISSAEFGQTQVDEQNIIIMKYKDGVLADLSSSVAIETGYDAVIIGEEGKLVVPKFWSAEEAYLYDSKNQLVEAYNEPHHENGYEYEAYEVNRCLRENMLESDKLPLKDTLDIMRIMDQIRSEWGLVYPQE
ncbi:MAG: Gfo/Idh/MocA family oxidoreductase [Clostridiales bacterium]|nr:Gfo/Idh/MocA family oxidoreductase [Clostridiales bacterium]